MRKFTLLMLIALSLNLTTVISQTNVVTTPQHKNVVLEEYTGIHCGYCPDGHLRAQDIMDANPDRVVLINVHAGSYANPSAGEPDFRTAFGDILAGEMGVSGYPSGTVNRHVFTEIGPAPAMSRSNWAYGAYQLFPQQSLVNVGYTSFFDTTTRELTVVAELYYTGNSPASSNFLQVAFLENHVIGYQSDYANGTQQNYDHKYILRHLLTGQWGYEITTTTQGSFTTETFTYVVPADYDINNCDIAVYVSENHFEVYTGVKGIANGGSHDGTTSIYIGDLDLTGDNVSEGTTGVGSSFSANMTSSLAGDESFEVSLSSDNAPTDWSASYFYDGVEYTSADVFTLSNYTASTFDIVIVPGSTVGFPKYTLEIQSVTYPSASPRLIDVFVISGVTDLIVNGTGGWGDGETYNFDQNIKDGLDLAGNSAYALVDGKVFVNSMGVSALSSVNNVYLNIGWRFPSFSDDQANAIMTFMDNGGNIFVAGQDIGWDIASGDGYGTPTTATLYSDYFHADFVSDGSGSNSQLTAVASDEIFGTMSASPIVDIYNGNFYPDQVSPLGNAVSIFNYNGQSSKTSGIRFENTDYKMVYLCVDLAMLSDVAVQKDLIKRTHDWFYGTGSIDNLLVNTSLNLYPNPAKDLITIDVESENINDYVIEVFDVTGKTILEIIQSNQSSFTRDLNLSGLKSGIYFINLKTENGNMVKRFEKL